MRSTLLILIGLLIAALEPNPAMARQKPPGNVIHYAQTGIAGKDESGRVLTKAGHVDEAWKQAEAAAEAGRQGDGKGLGEHARTALVQVESALTQSIRDKDLLAARSSLMQAIERNDAGNADEARQAIDEALGHLRAIR